MKLKLACLVKLQNPVYSPKVAPDSSVGFSKSLLAVRAENLSTLPNFKMSIYGLYITIKITPIIAKKNYIRLPQCTY